MTLFTVCSSSWRTRGFPGALPARHTQQQSPPASLACRESYRAADTRHNQPPRRSSAPAQPPFTAPAVLRLALRFMGQRHTQQTGTCEEGCEMGETLVMRLYALKLHREAFMTLCDYTDQHTSCFLLHYWRLKVHLFCRFITSRLENYTYFSLKSMKQWSYEELTSWPLTPI